MSVNGNIIKIKPVLANSSMRTCINRIDMLLNSRLVLKSSVFLRCLVKSSFAYLHYFQLHSLNYSRLVFLHLVTL